MWNVSVSSLPGNTMRVPLTKEQVESVYKSSGTSLLSHHWRPAGPKSFDNLPYVVKSVRQRQKGRTLTQMLDDLDQYFGVLGPPGCFPLRNRAAWNGHAPGSADLADIAPDVFASFDIQRQMANTITGGIKGWVLYEPVLFVIVWAAGRE